jgi:hypothetical protein
MQPTVLQTGVLLRDTSRAGKPQRVAVVWRPA